MRFICVKCNSNFTKYIWPIYWHKTTMTVRSRKDAFYVFYICQKINEIFMKFIVVVNVPPFTAVFLYTANAPHFI